jgi:hypothetical protein
MSRIVPPGNAAFLVLLTTAMGAYGAGCGAGSSTSSPHAETTDGGDAAVEAFDGAAADDAASLLADSGGPSVPDTSDGGCPQGSKPDGDGGCLPPSIRRPFLVGATLRSSRSRVRADWARYGTWRSAEPDLCPRTARLLSETWLKDALEEHASIAAFARFSLHLLAVGAPPELLVMSHRAALDEIVHARACFALAARYGGGNVRGPSALRVDDAMEVRTLAQIAELTAEEGCVGETLGAVLAREQLLRVTEPDVKRVLATIAVDEARHAELGWRFVRWAVTVGGRDVAQAVARGVSRACKGTLAAEERQYDVDHDAWRAHGRLTCRESKELARQAITELVTPCLGAALG